jgi:hypothetical protein
MPNTWSHLCNANNSFSTLPLTQDCKVCGTDYRVQAMRYDGYLPLASSKKKTTAGNNIKAKLAALLRPTTKQSKQDEHQNLYYDRQG